MNIFINGNNNCNNVIVNGRIVSSGSGNSLKFDEKRIMRSDGIDCVTINSNVNVTVIASNINVIEAHFHGEVNVDNKPTLNIKKNGREVFVTLNVTGNILGNLTLTVNIPQKKFDMINITSHNGSLSVKDGVLVDMLRLSTYNGDVESDCNFNEITATTHNGDADIYIDAETNVNIEASSHNGNVSIELQSISTSNIYASTRNGKVRNRFRAKNSGYTAYGQANSYNGNITVK